MQRIGRYEVLDHLASGGMGHVYLARMTGVGGFERQVVVKALDVSGLEDDAMVTMFLDEARLLGALHHHYIAPAYDVGCDRHGRYFLVMDYIDGETVEVVWRTSQQRGSTLPLAFAFTVVSSIASALDYAHSLRAPDGEPLGIVHRDVSLSNIMIGHDGAVKLIDFGIAKAANRTSQTQVGALKGKMGYLAPEQIHHKHIDHRADIFALGIVLYELTTMTRAFQDSSDLNTLERITAGKVTLPSALVDGYPPELEEIVMRALAVDPAARFESAGTMGCALEALAHRLGLQLGHAAISSRMRELFEGRRRRFGRGSSELAPLPRRPQAAPHEVDDVPTMPMEMPLEVASATAAHSPDPEPVGDREVVEVMAPRSELPVVVRFSPPAMPTSPPFAFASTLFGRFGTAELVRAPPTGPRDVRMWLIVCAVIAALIAVAIALS